MAQAQTHPIFLITEILEAILLHTDMCTLLTSAQRVCHRWHDLIKESRDLQAALFFTPVKYTVPWGTKRTRNPLLEENLWPRFLRRQLHTKNRGYYYECSGFPMADAEREEAYLREEASWRRMLLQQLPTSHIGIVETGGYGLFSQLAFKPDNDFIRMRHIEKAVDHFDVLPGRDRFLFWSGTGQLKWEERRHRDEREIATSKYLIDCDIVVFTYTLWILRDWQRNEGIEDWIKSLGEFRRVRGRYIQPIEFDD